MIYAKSDVDKCNEIKMHTHLPFSAAVAMSVVRPAVAVSTNSSALSAGKHLVRVIFCRSGLGPVHTGNVSKATSRTIAFNDVDGA